MRVEGWVMTNRVGSKTQFNVRIDDGDLIDMDEEERSELIDDAVRDAVFGHIEWGWNVKENQRG